MNLLSFEDFCLQNFRIHQQQLQIYRVKIAFYFIAPIFFTVLFGKQLNCDCGHLKAAMFPLETEIRLIMREND